MRKKLTRQGNSAALVRPLRALSPRRRAAFARALGETNRVWGTMLRRLAGR